MTISSLVITVFTVAISTLILVVFVYFSVFFFIRVLLVLFMRSSTKCQGFGCSALA